MSTTFRVDLRAAMVASVNVFIAANPSLLRRVYTSRPTTFATDTPFAYIDLLGERDHFDNQTRERLMNPSVVVVSRPNENAQQTAAFDTLCDALNEHLATYIHFVPNSVWDDLVIADESEEIATQEGTNIWPVLRFTFENLTLMDGRP